MARKKPQLLQRVKGQNYAGQEQYFCAAKVSLQLFSAAEHLADTAIAEQGRRGGYW